MCMCYATAVKHVQGPDHTKKNVNSVCAQSMPVFLHFIEGYCLAFTATNLFDLGFSCRTATPFLNVPITVPWCASHGFVDVLTTRTGLLPIAVSTRNPTVLVSLVLNKPSSSSQHHFFSLPVIIVLLDFLLPLYMPNTYHQAELQSIRAT